MTVMPFILISALTAYGYSVYHFRERRHVHDLEIIRRGGPPPGETQAALRFRTLTVGATALILLLGSAWFIVLGGRLGHYSAPLYVLSGFFLLLFLFAAALFLDNTHPSMSDRKRGKLP